MSQVVVVLLPGLALLYTSTYYTPSPPAVRHCLLRSPGVHASVCHDPCVVLRCLFLLCLGRPLF